MKRVLFVLSLGLPFTACLNVRPCTSDAECAPSGRCDVERQFCVFDPDSGAAGGGGGGSGGGGGGSGGGGGGVLGGGGGDTGGGGGAMGGGGGATMGGGMGGGGVTMGGGMGGGGPTGGGGGGPTGGGGGGAVDGGPDPFCATGLNCVDPLECQPSRSGGQCVPAYVLTFVQPTPNQALSGSSPADFVVSLRRPDGGYSALSAVPFSIPALTSTVPSSLSISGTPGVYRAQVMFPQVTRSYQAIAGWDGGPLTTVDFTVDTVPPVLTLEAAATPDGGAHLRDELLPVAIHSTKPLNPASIVLTLTGTDGGVSVQMAPVASSLCTARSLVLNAATDSCGQLDLAAPPMAGLATSFRVSVTATDQAGNAGTFSNSVQVTRIRWRSSVASVTTQVRAAPALDSHGDLFIGTQDTATTGRLLSFTPDGVLRFSLSAGAVQSVAIAESDVSGGLRELAYFASVTGGTTSSMRILSVDGGAITLGSPCLDGTRLTSSAIGLYDAGVGMNGGLAEIAALMVFNPLLVSDHGNLCSYGPRSGSFTSVGDSSLAQPAVDGTSVLSPANIVFSGNRGFFQRVDNTLGYVNTGPLSSSGSSASYSGIGAIPTGLAMGGNAIIGTWISGGFSSSPPLASYLLSNPASPSPAPLSLAWGNAARSPAILGSAVITATTGTGPNWLLSLPANLAGATLSVPVAVAAPNSTTGGGTTPIVGTGQRVYVVERDGRLYVYDASPTSGIAGLTPNWGGDFLFSSAVDVVAHPTLDCSRVAPGRPGTLYVVAGDGRVVAVIVDSTKLEPSAPWPKWQRTAGNAGNPEFPLNPGCP